MAYTVDDFMAAISGQESGGDYNATNPDSGAAGRFQIMPANWPSWSQEAGLGPGAPMTPANQDAVARFKMQQYYNQFGNWEDVAAAWYSGQPRNDATLDRPQNGYPTIREYVSSVMGRLNSRPPGGGGTTTNDYPVIPTNDGSYPGPTTFTTPTSTPSSGMVDQIMQQYGFSREEALQFLGISGSGGYDPLGPDKLAEDIFRDRRDFSYDATQDQLDRDRQAVQDKIAEDQRKFDNAMAVGDFKAAQQAAADLNYWKGQEMQLEQQRINLTNQGQQLDYNLGLGNIAADRYGVDANLMLGRERLAADTALGQQQNQTSQFDAETARLQSERNYLIGMANAKTDADRAEIEEKRRLDAVAIANMEDRTRFILGQQQNQVGAFNADTDRQRGNQTYLASLAQALNDANRIGVDDRARIDDMSRFNVDQTNQFNLGQQGNQTNQFGAETDRANRMGQLALENNRFIAEMANSPRDFFSLFAMQRGVAPDWGTIMAGGTPAQGAALAPASVMNAYTPTTAAPQFNLTAAQAQAQQAPQQQGNSQFGGNWFLENWEKGMTANSALPQFGAEHQTATGQAGGNYGAGNNQFIGAQPGYQPQTSAPSFNYTPQSGGSPQWTGPAAQSGFIEQTSPGSIKPPTPQLQDINPGGLQGGVPVAGLKPGLNLSTVGGPDIKGSDFNYSAFYDEGMTQQVKPDDIVKSGSQLYVYYMPQGQQQHQPPAPTHSVGGTPLFANGGMTAAEQFITGDDPEHPSGLGPNAELNEPLVGPDGRYMGTRVTPLNPARRPVGGPWNGDLVRMAAGFGIRPANLFSKAA